MAIHTALKSFFIAIIGAYRYLFSPWVGCHCRFNPTCSQFAMDALERHGCIKGLYLSTKRLLSCHPWHAGGYDPVP